MITYYGFWDSATMQNSCCSSFKKRSQCVLAYSKKTIKQNSYYGSFDNRLIHILAKLKYHNSIVPVVYLLFIVKESGVLNKNYKIKQYTVIIQFSRNSKINKIRLIQYILKWKNLAETSVTLSHKPNY